MFFRYTILPISWAVIVAFLILLPGKDLPGSGGLLAFDKIAHTCVFAFLVLLCVVGFTKQNKFQFLKKRSLLSAIAVGLGYSLILEFSQIFIPERQFDRYDIVANSSGIIFGGLLFILIYRI